MMTHGASTMKKMPTGTSHPSPAVAARARAPTRPEADPASPMMTSQVGKTPLARPATLNPSSRAEKGTSVEFHRNTLRPQRQPHARMQARRVLRPRIHASAAILEHNRVTAMNHLGRLPHGRAWIELRIADLEWIFLAHFAEVPAQSVRWPAVTVRAPEALLVLRCAVPPERHESDDRTGPGYDDSRSG